MTNNRKDIRYGHPSHRLFNEQLVERSNPKPVYDVVKRPWMSEQARASLPHHRHDFLKNTDPARLKEIEARTMTETERRGESEKLRLREAKFNARAGKTTRSSKMVKQDQAEANLNPPPEIRHASDHEKFNHKWMVEQRDAAMRSNARIERSEPDQPQIERQYREPER